jgi:hypothetical protein
MELIGRIHTDICSIPLFSLPGVRLQMKFTKAKPSFYLMNKDVNAKVTFKFLDAKLLVKRVKPNPAIVLYHNSVLSKGNSQNIT